MHCCIAKLPLEEINKTDKERNAAMTYISNNNNREVADFLFINDVNVGEINLDSYGIIQFYIDRIKYIDELRRKACKKIFDKTNERNNCKSTLRSAKTDDFFLINLQ